MAVRPSDILSLFWAPVCAIGSHGGDGPNACIAVSVLGASIVPERPRLVVGLYKTNHTTSLVRESGTLAISVLGERQVPLLKRLGLSNGQAGPKLEGLEFVCTTAGDPYFPGAAGFMDCGVIDALDAGDASFFLCAVHDRSWTSDQSPLDRWRALDLAGDEFRAAWAAKQAREQDASRKVMRWLAARGTT